MLEVASMCIAGSKMEIAAEDAKTITRSVFVFVCVRRRRKEGRMEGRMDGWMVKLID